MTTSNLIRLEKVLKKIVVAVPKLMTSFNYVPHASILVSWTINPQHLHAYIKYPLLCFLILKP